MKTFLSLWRSYLMPTPAALALVSAAGALMAAGFACAALYGFSATDSFAKGVGAFTFTFGFMVMPVVIVLLLIAGLRDARPLPRGLLWGAAALAVLASGGLSALGIGLSSDVENPFVTGFGTLLFCFSPPAILIFGLALYFLAKGWPELRVAIAAERERRAIQMIEARGEVALADLAAELGLPVTQCDDLVDAALKAERFFGWHDAPRGRVYSAAALRERQTRLAAVVVARGQIRLDELGRELSAPRDLVRTWIYELVKRHEFTGYINWDEGGEGTLYSAEAQRLTAAGKCPHCNGELSLAGKGVIRCGFCSSEIFL